MHPSLKRRKLEPSLAASQSSAGGGERILKTTGGEHYSLRRFMLHIPLLPICYASDPTRPFPVNSPLATLGHRRGYSRDRVPPPAHPSSFVSPPIPARSSSAVSRLPARSLSQVTEYEKILIVGWLHMQF